MNKSSKLALSQGLLDALSVSLCVDHVPSWRHIWFILIISHLPLVFSKGKEIWQFPIHTMESSSANMSASSSLENCLSPLCTALIVILRTVPHLFCNKLGFSKTEWYFSILWKLIVKGATQIPKVYFFQCLIWKAWGKYNLTTI